MGQHCPNIKWKREHKHMIKNKDNEQWALKGLYITALRYAIQRDTKTAFLNYKDMFNYTRQFMEQPWETHVLEQLIEELGMYFPQNKHTKQFETHMEWAQFKQELKQQLKGDID